MSEKREIEFNAGIFPLVMSIIIDKEISKDFTKDLKEMKLSIDLPRGVCLLYIQKMFEEHNELETDLFKKYVYGIALTDADYYSLLSLIMKPISRNWRNLNKDDDILSSFGITIISDDKGEKRFSIIKEAEDSIRIETWENIIIDILHKTSMDIIDCFDFDKYFQRGCGNLSEKLTIHLGAWRFTVDNVVQNLSNALRNAFMFTLVGYYVGDRKKQYSSFEEYFENEFYKRVSLVYGVWSSIEKKEEVKYIPLYDSFYNLSKTSKNELISILKAVLDNDDIALDEKQTLKNQLIIGAGKFHSNVTTADISLEQNLIKPAINYILLREKAKETVESAEILCSNGKYVDCANRCYYAMMFTLKMLLEHQGKLADWKPNELKESETHNSLENGLMDLVKNGVLDLSDKADFDYVKDQRWKCDYSLYNFNKADASYCISKIKKFFLKAERIIG